MSILSKIKTGRRGRAQKVVIYAPEGFGKSTLASRFPEPLFFDVEDSTSQMDVARLSRADLPDLRSFESALLEVAKARPCQTLVVDTIDWLEQMAVDAIVAEAKSDKIQGIEDFGYGKGYTILREKLTIQLAKLDEVIAAGIHVVLLAHSKVVKFEPPDGAGPYDRYELKLSKQVAPLVKEWADAVLFGNWRTQVKERDKHESGAQFKGVGGKERLLYCNRTAAWDAKNRHGLGDVEKWEIATVERAFCSVGAPWATSGGPVSAPEVKPEAAKGPMPARDGSQVRNGSEALRVESARGAMNGFVGDEDQIPGLPVAKREPDELDRIVGTHEAAVNAFLVGSNRIRQGETYRDVAPDYRARVLKNPAGFLKVALNGRAH